MAITHQPSRQYKRIGLAMTLCFVALLSIIDGQGTAWAGKSAPASITATPRSPVGSKGKAQTIVLKPLNGFYALQAQVSMKLDGKTDAGKVVRGTVLLDTAYDTKADMRVISVSGDLLPKFFGDDEQMKSLGIKKLMIYKRGKDNYMSFEGKQSLCLPMEASEAKKMSESLTIDSLFGDLSLGTGENAFVGTPSGEETRNGIRTQRYQLDAEATTDLMQKADIQKAASVSSGTLWVAKTGGHMVRLEINMRVPIDKMIGSETYEGNIFLVVNLSKFNEPLQMKLPKVCQS